MKTCPVCQAVAFDDAELCYGCLHRFGEDNAPYRVIAESENTPPAFSIRFTPEADKAGGVVWNCAVEMA